MSLEDLRELVMRHAPAEGVSTRMPGLRLMATARPTELASTLYEPAIVLVVQGRKRTVLGEGVLTYGAGEYLIVPIEVPVSGQVSQASAARPFLALALALQPALIASVLLDGVESEGGASGPHGPTVAKANDPLIGAFSRLLALLDNPSEAAFLRPMIEREIVWRLLLGQHGQGVRQIGLADGQLAKIRHAIEQIRSEYDRPLRIADLARASGMSTTSFHRHFRAATCVTPHQYQKRIRLHVARTQLMAGKQSVAGVGFSVGYDSPSQFSREYSRLFGVPPGKDGIQLRGRLHQGQDMA